MRFSKWLGVVILLGCQERAPTGQVVATLPNSEITAKELNYETRLSGRYKDRMRLYLTRNDENGERTVFWIDTADYKEDLPEAVYEVEVGDVLTLNGKDWNVHLREMLVAIQMETDRIIKNYRQSGQTIYKVGHGPSFIGSNGTDTDK